MPLTKYYDSNESNENKTRRACETRGGRREMHEGFLWENIKVRDYLEDLEVNSSMLKYLVV